MRKKRLLPLLFGLSALLTACVGSAEPTLLPAPEMEPSGAVTAIVPTPTDLPLPPGLEAEVVAPLVQGAVIDLASRNNVAFQAVEVLAVEPVEWPDAAVGCPAEGYDYAQVITPGYRIQLGLDGTEYTYHTDRGTFIVLCLGDGSDELLSIPIHPGERIMDGIPWMPVDPVPSGEGDIADPAPIK